MRRKRLNIAIDGPSGSGKSTLAKLLAKKYNLIYIDTGAIYRTIGLYAMRAGVDRTDTEGVISLLPQMKIEMTLENGGGVVWLNGERMGDELRTPECSLYASDVSKIPAVREYILELQRGIARRNDCVMDGRDIGTVILPKAQVKIFLFASVEKRAERRLIELREKGEDVTLEQVLEDMRWRDENDKTRKIAPAIPAPDAVMLDNGGLGIEATLDAASEIIESKVKI
ncbi:MAG: (d)CMP kinase [Clostridia bacterium]|jgi:cytidylate kinase|nr:(d)CMP kinase [Clostridia bacterium]MBO7400361.1 (d)CMP kinase [Clostridia bacterium]MBO7549719.1 (d)CMP kinase [Clostridia bacterium]MBP5657919.1 (d)CMP kinase [Clostridia bacterium]